MRINFHRRRRGGADGVSGGALVGSVMTSSYGWSGQRSSRPEVLNTNPFPKTSRQAPLVSPVPLM